MLALACRSQWHECYRRQHVRVSHGVMNVPHGVMNVAVSNMSESLMVSWIWLTVTWILPWATSQSNMSLKPIFCPKCCHEQHLWANLLLRHNNVAQMGFNVKQSLVKVELKKFRLVLKHKNEIVITKHLNVITQIPFFLPLLCWVIIIYICLSVD